MNPYRLRAYILLLITSVIWAIAGPVIKLTLDKLSPLTFLTYRFGISTLAAILTFFFTGIHIPKNKKILLTIFAYGFITTTVTLGLLFWGLSGTTVLDMSLISLVGPIIIAVAGVAFLNEHVTKREKIGMGIATLGMLFIIIEPIINGDGLGRLSGNILILFYLLANGVSIVLLKKLLREKVGPLALTNISFIVGFVTIAPLTVFRYGLANVVGNIQNLSLPYHLGVFFLALLSGNIAYALGNKAQKTIEVSEAALFSYLYPILAMPIAVLWLKEKITISFVAGAFVIAIGVVIAELKKRSYN